MLAISLRFPTKRFHATPWGRQVNEGAVEWPPSPWRLLRSLVAVWHHKFPEVPEEQMRALIERLASPPRFQLPPASQGHTRHYMPLVNDSRTKVFDTFVVVSPEDCVVAAWPEVALTTPQRELLRKLLAAMSYFGRAESWIDAELLDATTVEADVMPCELGESPPPGRELVRTLVPVLPATHADWACETRRLHRQRALAAASARAKGKKKAALSKKQEQAIDAALPATLFDALHAESAELRDAGWNVPPGARWINYMRLSDAFASRPRPSARVCSFSARPTVARFAVCGPVRPLLTESVLVGERVRSAVMSKSREVSGDAAAVFSGRRDEKSRLDDGHQHAHYLCEALAEDGRISHCTVFAPAGFDREQEMALGRVRRVWGKDGYELQLVLLGVGQPGDFGGLNEKAGESKLLAGSRVWVSRTPFVSPHHLRIRDHERKNPEKREAATRRELERIMRNELRHRDWLSRHADSVVIESLLEPMKCGTYFGDHFTPWVKFRRERLTGNGERATTAGFGCRLVFVEPVTGPIALGYACHFGLGLFVPESD